MGVIVLVLGKYELLDREESGGQASVLAARRISDGRRVAIKVISGTGIESEREIANDLYELELRILKKLKGLPNVIELIDSGFDENLNESVIVLEWLEVSLSDKLSRLSKVIPEAEWIRFSKQLIETVARAHSRSVAHRDIKPANIMFRSNSPADWDCVLIDFGISKLVGVDVPDPNQTMREYRTPAYASADFMREEDFARDVYGLAAVMIRLRTTRDFDYDYTVQDAVEELASLPNITSRYVPILKKGVEPRAEKRFKTIKEFHLALATQGSSDPRNRGTKYFTLRLSAEAKDQLQELQHDTNSRDYANLRSLLAGQVYLRLPKDSDPKLTTDRFNLQVGFLDLKCKGPASDSRTPNSIYVREIKELDQSEMEFKVAHTKAVAQGKYCFILEADRYATPIGQAANFQDYVQLVANPKKPSVDDPNEELAKRVNKWEAILEAKEEYILGCGKRTQFELIDGSYRSLNLKPVLDSEVEFKVPSTWSLEGATGIQLTLDYQDEDGTLSFTSNRDARNFPTSGVIYPTLGENAPSFRRQKQALESIKEHGADLGNWVQVIIDPSRARFQDLREPLNVFDSKLDDAKRAALEVALAAEDIALVQGPPGTGKTSFIVELVKQFTQSGAGNNKVLLVSQTHIAVDNALERLNKSGISSLLRVGRDEKVSPEARPFLIDQRLSAWQAKVEKSSSEFLRVLLENLGCSQFDIQRLAALSRLRDLRGWSQKVGEPSRFADVTTFAEQVDQALDDAGVQKVESPETDIETLGQEEKEVVFALQDLGYERSELLNWNSGDISATMGELLSQGPNIRRGWSLVEAQSRWIRLFRLDEHLKRTYVGRTQVIAGTCIGFLGDRYARDMEFDLCIIDEASKATATEILVPMSRSRKTILVGDTHQLPPTEEQLTRDSKLLEKYELTAEDVETTLFETLAQGLPNTSQKLLSRQYRMLPAIGEMISKVFYNGAIESESREVPDWVASAWGAPLQFIDTSFIEKNQHDEVGTSVRNRLEAAIAVQTVGNLLANLTFSSAESENPRIVILAPYAAQVTEIRRVLSRQKIGVNHVEVMTFDSAQGIECDFAVVTATRSGDPSTAKLSANSRFGFIAKSKWKRINVGLSRARFGLAIIGNRTFLREGSGFADVIRYLEASGSSIRNAEINWTVSKHG